MLPDEQSLDCPQISLKNVSLTYQGAKNPAFQVADISISSGECVLVTGRSGAGKSTFLHLLSGLLPDEESQLFGTIRVGRCRAGKETSKEFAHQVASTFQEPIRQFFHQKVKHELAFPAENQGLATTLIQKRLAEVADCFELTHLLERDCLTLSGGEQQRLAMAVAVMQDTPIIILDEPTSHLDAASITQLRSQIIQLKKRGKTLLIAEHMLAYLLDLADRVLYIDSGHLRYDWLPSQVLSLSSDKRKQLGLRQLDLSTCQTLLEHKIQETSPNYSSGLSIENISLFSDSQCLLSHLSVACGEIVGLVGSNGRGKSTLAQILAGTIKPKQGRIFWQSKVTKSKERLKLVSLVLQDVRLQLFTANVAEELRLGGAKKEIPIDLLSHLGLVDLLKRHPQKLSGGEQQRLMIAASLLSEKPIFIFDEPTSNLDGAQLQAFMTQVIQLKQEGKAILIISHDVELLASICDWIYRL
ncbi:ABC transporter ATP-binding protein [Streptococcus sciuri]|uniref:ABC transporter ATP-binding protein n=1 Tax=Streptococcus sciuri TaxID=2973939 RepID=A0ABT2F5X6_9STRE|nr:ABC transporter ATP-binding protein [Streptococcus sciuri]MCS4487829.1 ABC transporter ATP-binding protein [Streptococcus sciuri]